jgi:hypothetical protein
MRRHAPADDALRLRRPLADNALWMVAMAEKADEWAVAAATVALLALCPRAFEVVT